MSLKYGSLSSYATPLRSQTIDTLNALMAQEDADKKFQLQMIREDRRDALAQARMNLEDKRYNDALARADQEKADARTIAMEEASVMPILFDTTKKGTETYKTGDTANEYDTKKLIEDYNKNPNMFDTKTPDQLQKIKINEQDLKIEDAYNRIMIDPKNDTTSKKKKAFRSWLSSNGYQNIVDEEDGTFKSLIKPVFQGLSHIGEAGMTAAGAVGSVFQSPEGYEKDQDTFNKNTKIMHDYWKTDNILDFGKNKVKELESIRTKNATIDSMNEKDKLNASKSINDVLDKYKTGKTIDVTNQRETDIAIDPNTVLTQIFTDVATRADKIKNDKTLTQAQKDGRIKGLLAQRNKAVEKYQTNVDRLLKREDKIFETNLEFEKQKSLKQIQYNFDVAKKALDKNPEDLELQRQYDIAKLELTRAKTINEKKK